MGESVILWKEDVLPDAIHNALLESFQSLHWYDGEYKGRKISRKQRWYHVNGSRFCNKWPDFERWQSNDYTPLLTQAQHYIQTYVESLNIHVDINSILLNYYENGKIIIPKHRDNEEIFGDNPVVIVVSLGSSRTLRFTRIEPNSISLKATGEIIDIDLKPKSMLIMSGTTQKYFCHEILPCDSCLPRYSMTFRHHSYTK